MKKTFLIAAGVLLAVASANQIRLNAKEAAAKAARTARYQSLVGQCLASGRYSIVPTYESWDYLRVYQSGSISPTSQCAEEALRTMAGK